MWWTKLATRQFFTARLIHTIVSYRPQTVTHTGTNRVWRSATTLIEANALPLSQTANQPLWCVKNPRPNGQTSCFKRHNYRLLYFHLCCNSSLQKEPAGLAYKMVMPRTALFTLTKTVRNFVIGGARSAACKSFRSVFLSYKLQMKPFKWQNQRWLKVISNVVSSPSLDRWTLTGK